MKRFAALVIITIMMLTSCDLHPNDPPQLSNEEHAIISAVLDSIRLDEDPTGTLDVYDMTTTSISIYSLSIAFDGDSIGSATLLSNYNTANSESYALDMDKLPDFVMLKDTEETGPYSDFLRFTRPGISDDGLTAIVEYSYMSAPLAGCGMAALLEKQDDQWVMVWLKMMWVS